MKSHIHITLNQEPARANFSVILDSWFMIIQTNVRKEKIRNIKKNRYQISLKKSYMHITVKEEAARGNFLSPPRQVGYNYVSQWNMRPAQVNQSLELHSHAILNGQNWTSSQPARSQDFY